MVNSVFTRWQKIKEKHRYLYVSFVFFMLTLFALNACFKNNANVDNAASWIETPCVIETFENKKLRKSQYHFISIQYVYEFGNVQYIGERYNLGRQVVSPHFVDALKAKYQIGSTTSCYVNPKNPYQSVLTNQIDSEMVNSQVGGIFLAFGSLIGAIVYFRKWRYVQKFGPQAERPGYHTF